MKRIGKFVVVVLMAVLFLVNKTDVYGDVYGEILEYEDFEYEILDDGTVEIVGLRSSYNDDGEKITEISIPQEINGRKVTSIGWRAFGIGDYVAWGSFNYLESVQIPDTVTSIGESAFYNCNTLKSINIPESVTSIGQSAFHNCSSLESIKLSNGITTIKKDTFSYCNKLKTVELPNKLKKIEDYAFSSCSSLENINIPDTVTFIGKKVFYCNSSLREINLPDKITEIKDNTFSGCWKLGCIEIPKSVKIIGEGAFNCATINNITIPKSVKKIKKNAFSLSSIQNIYYQGSKSEWKKIAISKQYAGESFYNAKIHYRTKTPATKIIGKIEFNDNSLLYNTNNSLNYYNYNGKSKKPKIIVKSISGKVLKPGNYTVQYKNNKKVGFATVVVKGKGNYVGNAIKQFEICPKGTSITTAIPKKRSFTVKWKKQKNQITGYQIEYSTKKDFSKNVKFLDVKKDVTSATIKGLKSKKIYYVRIRTWYTTTTDSANHWSEWSEIKKVKTK